LQARTPAPVDNGKGILVRDLPYTTTELQGLRNLIFFGGQLTQQLSEVIKQRLAGQFKADYDKYTPGNPPKYVALAPGLVDADYQNLDLPIFYRRVDELDIVDSHGKAVPIPLDERQQNRVGRATYYPAGLLTDLRNNLAKIRNNPAGRNNRIDELLEQVLKILRPRPELFR